MYLISFQRRNWKNLHQQQICQLIVAWFRKKSNMFIFVQFNKVYCSDEDKYRHYFKSSKLETSIHRNVHHQVVDSKTVLVTRRGIYLMEAGLLRDYFGNFSMQGEKCYFHMEGRTGWNWSKPRETNIGEVPPSQPDGEGRLGVTRQVAREGLSQIGAGAIWGKGGARWGNSRARQEQGVGHIWAEARWGQGCGPYLVPYPPFWYSILYLVPNPLSGTQPPFWYPSPLFGTQPPIL